MTRRLGPAWLTAERVALYGSLIPALYAAVLFFGILFPAEGLEERDFIAFHAAARLAWLGEAAAAYDDDRLQVMRNALVGDRPDGTSGYFGWFNPPHFLFALLPLAPLSYAHAWAVWIIASGGALALGLRAVLPGAAPLVAVLSLPVTLVSLGVGQNGVVIAALLAGTLGLMDRRPVVAGICLGQLTIKPHIGILFPILLALTGRWRCFAAATVTALLAAAAALLAFGSEPWLAFFGQLGGGAGRYLLDGDPVMRKIQSVYAGVAYLTGKTSLAAVLHGATALAATVLVLRLWLHRPEAQAETRAAALIAGTYLVTPYVWMYDMPAFGVAALFLLRAMLRDGALPWERPLLALAAILPAFAVNPQPFVGTAVWWTVLILAWRRDRAFRGGAFSQAVPVPSS